MTRIEGKKPTKTLWIFCEGKTEKLYFDKLKFEERISRLKIKALESGHKNADGLVQEALDFMKKGDYIDDDLVACLFDRDENSNVQLNKSKSLAGKNILVCYSNPCFEFWILCHHGYYPSSEERKSLVAKLNDVMKGYEKNDSALYSKTKDRIKQAVANAERIKEKHLKNGVELISRESNPLTLVFEVVKLIDGFRG